MAKTYHYEIDRDVKIVGRKETQIKHIRAHTEQEFQEKVAYWQRKLDVGVDGTMTVAEYSKRWLADISQDRRTAASFAMYTEKLNNYILPVIGSLRLDAVTTGDCNRVLRQASQMSRSTVNKIETALRSLIGSAFDDGLIETNPLDRLKKPSNLRAPAERRPITSDERRALLAVCMRDTLRDGKPNDSGGFYMLLLCCGLRPEEAAALKKRDIDWSARMITVAAAKEKGSGYHEKELKGGVIKARQVGMTADFAAWFHAWLDRHLTRPECEFVFAQRDRKTPVTDSSLAKKWATYRTYLDIEMGAEWEYRTEQGKRKKHLVIKKSVIAPDFTPYLLRHTYGTQLAEAGVPQLQIASVMGHTTTKTTEKYYIHRTATMAKEAQKRMEEYHKTHSELRISDLADWALSADTKAALTSVLHRDTEKHELSVELFSTDIDKLLVIDIQKKPKNLG